MNKNFYLQLVNASHPVVFTPEEASLLPAHPDYPHIRLEASAARALQALLGRLKAFDEIVPVSGFRTMEEQRNIWKSSMREHGYIYTRNYVALPGCSEHETGLAIDLAAASHDIDFICPKFPDTGIYGEFRRLAASYGFILRYPPGKEDLTGIASEPWHFRYVGTPCAAEIMQKHLVLEEYLTQSQKYAS